jgi:glucose/arabinose dehydrogenase
MIGLIGIKAPEGNTPCGEESLKQLRKLSGGGLRLFEEPGLTFDARGRRMYYALPTVDNVSVAEKLVAGGFADVDGTGKNKDVLARLKAGAMVTRAGCLWQTKAELPDDAASSMALKTTTSETVAAAPSVPPQGTIAGALPSGFTQETVIGGLSYPTAFAFLPDGRILIAEQFGVVRIYKNGALLPTPFIDIDAKVNHYTDRGLIGIAVDPNFATNGYVYLSYTYESDPTQNGGTKTARVARYTASGDTASPSTEKVILGTQVGSSCENFPRGADCLPSDGPSHSIGNIKFGPDGTMWVTAGEGAYYNFVTDLALRAQDLDSLGGKVLHITPDGQGLATNPFYNKTYGNSQVCNNLAANCAKIWAYGLRNPWRFNFRPGSSVPYLGDVGWDTWEEVNVAKAGANLGWPCYEGGAQQAGYQSKPTCQTLYAQGASAVRMPLLTWNHDGSGSASLGGTFYTGNTFPAEYQGKYFYSDYVRGVIRYLAVDANDNLVGSPTDFADTGANPVDIQVGPDGNLYYAAMWVDELRRIIYGGGPPPPPPPGTSYLSDINWTFMGNGWGPVEKDRSNGEISGGDGQTLTLNGATFAKGLGAHAASDIRYGLAGNCTTFTAQVGVDDEVGSNGSVVFQVWTDGAKLFDSGTMTGTTATKSVNVNVTGRSELKLIVTDGGNGFDYDHADWADAKLTCPGGTGNHPPAAAITAPTSGFQYSVGQQISFAGSATDPDGDTTTLAWQVIQHHCPGGVCHTHNKFTANGPSGSFIYVDDEDDTTYLEFILTATDPGGLQGTASVTIQPKKVDVTLATSPPGLQVVYGGGTATAPVTQQAIVGATRTISAPTPQGSATFQSWSDGGAAQHNITIPTSAITYTATFTGTPPPTTRYLSDLNWTSASNGWGPVEKDRSNGESAAGDGHTLMLNGTTYAKGLGVHAASDVRFALSGLGCTTFLAQVGVDDEVGSNGSVVFQVWTDGTKLFDSGTMTGATATAPVNVTVTGKNELQLVVTDGGNGFAYDHGDWADAKLNCGSGGGPPPPTTGYLSDLNWTFASNGWGPVEKDHSNGESAAGDGHTLTLNGTTYAKGLGVHAASDVRYALAGSSCTTFTAQVGVDDEVGSNGSVVFQVWTDGTKLFDSGTMTGATATAPVNVTVTGKAELKLIVTDGGNGFDNDHGDWADAKLTCGS